MSKITYLFGAGASANALPIVRNISSNIEALINYYSQLNTIILDSYSSNEFDANSEKKQLVEDLNWLKSETSRHASIDTFAKKLFVNKRFDELNKLKVLISVFFSFLQVKNPIDPRYDHFFASIIGNSFQDLPKDISIISWNYDNQFELAYREYVNNRDIEVQETFLGIHNKSFKSSVEKNKFKIFKINGTSGNFYINHSCNKIINKSDYIFNEEYSIGRILERYSYFVDRINLPNITSSISFAWEDDSSNFKLLDHILEEAQTCQTLVIIGYSIPFFNRKIDKAILDSMDNLSTIYIQDKYPENIENRLEQLIPEHIYKNINVKYSTDLEQFLIPYEL